VALYRAKAWREWELGCAKGLRGDRCHSETVQIIVPQKGTETERKKREAYGQILKHYYGREIRDGSRFRSKAGTKEQIKKLYEVR
jgi:hypothetical protein